MTSKSGRISKLTLYYDGDCGFCAVAKRWLSRLDFFRSIEWTSCQTLEEPPVGLSWDDLDRYAWLDTGRGPLHKGFFAMRLLALRLPPLLPVAPLMWLPGAHIVGDAVYDWVSRNRYRLSSCPLDGGGRP